MITTSTIVTIVSTIIVSIIISILIVIVLTYNFNMVVILAVESSSGSSCVRVYLETQGILQASQIMMQQVKLSSITRKQARNRNPKAWTLISKPGNRDTQL